MIVTWNRFSKIILDWFASLIKRLTRLPFWGHFFILLLILMTGEILPMPGLNFLIFIISLVLQNFLTSYLLAVLSHLFSSSIIYFLVTYCFKNYFEKKFKDNTLFQLIKQESTRKPFKVTFVIRFIEVQEAFKNVMISLGPTSYFTFIYTNLVYQCFINAIFVYVGQGMTDPQKLLSPAGWKDKTNSEKTSFFVTYATLTLSFVIITCICCYTRDKVKRFKKEKKRIQEAGLGDTGTGGPRFGRNGTVREVGGMGESRVGINREEIEEGSAQGEGLDWGRTPFDYQSGRNRGERDSSEKRMLGYDSRNNGSFLQTPSPNPFNPGPFDNT